jgi:AcrR family transcriptional regulator
MARTKTAERREAILAAAREVFQDVGFDRASMDEIAARFGGSKATLYRYFENKEALFKELISRTANEMDGGMHLLLNSMGMKAEEGQLDETALQILALLDPANDVDSTLRMLGREALKKSHTPERFAGARMLVAAATDPEVGRIFYEQGIGQAVKFLETYFARVIEAGQLRQADPLLVARHFHALLDAEVFYLGLFNIKTTLDDAYIAEVVDRAVDVFLRAYQPPPPQQ